MNGIQISTLFQSAHLILDLINDENQVLAEKKQGLEGLIYKLGLIRIKAGI